MRGMKIRVAATAEWIGPRCWILGIRRSMSGIIDSSRINAMFMRVLRSFDAVNPQTCPSARCPTANRFVLLFRLGLQFLQWLFAVLFRYRSFTGFVCVFCY